MNYQVDWTPPAEQDLAERWLSASNREAVTTAAE